MSKCERNDNVKSLTSLSNCKQCAQEESRFNHKLIRLQSSQFANRNGVEGVLLVFVIHHQNLCFCLCPSSLCNVSVGVLSLWSSYRLPNGSVSQKRFGSNKSTGVLIVTSKHTFMPLVMHFVHSFHNANQPTGDLMVWGAVDWTSCLSCKKIACCGCWT